MKPHCVKALNDFEDLDRLSVLLEIFEFHIFSFKLHKRFRETNAYLLQQLFSWQQLNKYAENKNLRKFGFLVRIITEM